MMAVGKGRYIKSAERACARKARFETRSAAEAFVAGRYRAYRCVVCGSYHLTSGRGDRPEPAEPPKREPPGPKLGDLDWSAVLDPAPPKAKPESRILSPPPAPREEPPEAEESARCVGACGKDGRVALVHGGRLMKSRPVARELRPLLAAGVQVVIDGESPPRIVRLAGAD